MAVKRSLIETLPKPRPPIPGAINHRESLQYTSRFRDPPPRIMHLENAC
jgi:hypothetical protein